MPARSRLVRTCSFVAALSCCALFVVPHAAGAQGARHNVVLFVPDGLRGSIVSAETAPEMDRLRRAGVTFPNSHSIFPTFTTANASAMATGHLLGDTGDFSNTIYTGYKVAAAGLSFTPFLENDPVIADVDEHFGGNYLDEQTILAAAHSAGYATASIGKLGPTAIFDAADTRGTRTIVIDDATGRKDQNGNPVGRPLPDAIAQALQQTTGSAQAPTRGVNGNPTRPSPKSSSPRTAGAT